MDFSPRRQLPPRHSPALEQRQAPPASPPNAVQVASKRIARRSLLSRSVSLVRRFKLTKMRLIALGIILLLIGIVTTLNLIQSTQRRTLPSQQSSTPGLKRSTGSLEKGKPDYPVFTPNGASIDTFGGWTRVSPPDRDAVYAYTDTLGGAHITVSQQPLPDGFNEDTDAQVEQLAVGYSATEHLTVNGTTVYLGTSAKGPQSVIFTKSKTLILIKSSGRLSNAVWSSYISSLR